MRSALFLTNVLVFASASAFADSQAQPSDTQVDAAFAKADAAKNGTVSLAEAKRFGISEASFNKANPDKDGTLDQKEATKAGIKPKKTFDAANPDKDGTLDLSEYLNALVAQAK
jgi:hypothetical protein